MASRREDEIQGFLSRWSQRKRAAEESAEKAAVDPGAAEDREAAAGQAEPAGEAPVRPEDLPDIDTLDATSDFKVFMKQGVPSSLKRKALNKLWHSDPFFNEICMLDDYNLDYTDAAMVVPNLKTLYQVGKGMVLPDAPADVELAEDRAEGEDRAGETPQVTAETAPATSDAAAERGEPPQGTETGDSSGEPGKSAISSAATPARAAAETPAQRSARRRRWGDADG
jgi:hypothetical protein